MNNKFLLLLIFILYLCFNKNKENFSENVNEEILNSNLLLLKYDENYGYNILIGNGYTSTDSEKKIMVLYFTNKKDAKEYDFSINSEGKYMQSFTYNQDGNYYKSDLEDLYIYLNSSENEESLFYVNAEIYKSKAPLIKEGESPENFKIRIDNWSKKNLVNSNLQIIYTKDLTF